MADAEVDYLSEEAILSEEPEEAYVEAEVEEQPEAPDEPDITAKQAEAFRNLVWGTQSNPRAKEHWEALVAVLDGNEPEPEDTSDLDPTVAELKQRLAQVETSQQLVNANQGEQIYQGWVAQIEAEFGGLDDTLKSEMRRRADAGWLGPTAFNYARQSGENPLLGLLFQIAPERITSVQRDRAAKAGAAAARKASGPTPKASAAQRTESNPEEMGEGDLTTLMLDRFREEMQKAQGSL